MAKSSDADGSLYVSTFLRLRLFRPRKGGDSCDRVTGRNGLVGIERVVVMAAIVRGGGIGNGGGK